MAASSFCVESKEKPHGFTLFAKENLRPNENTWSQKDSCIIKPYPIPDSNRIVIWTRDKEKYKLEVFEAQSSDNCKKIAEYIPDYYINDVLPINAHQILCRKVEKSMDYFTPNKEEYLLLELKTNTLLPAVSQPNFGEISSCFTSLIVLDEEYIAKLDIDFRQLPHLKEEDAADGRQKPGFSHGIVSIFNIKKNFTKVGETFCGYNESQDVEKQYLLQVRKSTRRKREYEVQQIALTSTGNLIIFYRNGEVRLFARKSNGQGFEAVGTLHKNPALAQLKMCRPIPSPMRENELVFLGILPTSDKDQSYRVYQYNLDSGEVQIAQDKNEIFTCAIGLACCIKVPVELKPEGGYMHSETMKSMGILTAPIVCSPDKSAIYSATVWDPEGSYLYTIDLVRNEVTKELLTFNHPRWQHEPVFITSLDNGLLFIAYRGEFFLRETDYYKKKEEIATKIFAASDGELLPPFARISAEYCLSAGFFASTPIVNATPSVIPAKQNVRHR